MDAILYWNEVVNEADRTTHTTGDMDEARSQGPCGASRAYAIVHLAMHDAFFGINNKYDTYLPNLPTPPVGADTDSAIAAAAHATLSALYPKQKAFFNARHAAAGLPGQAGVDGHVFGQAVATAILAARQNDPTLSDDGYSSPVAPGHHRQDPDNVGQPFYAPFYGARSRCFASTSRHHLNPPPQLGTDEYNDAVAQIRSKGIAPHLIGTLPNNPLFPPRTATETTIGVFWAYDGVKGLGTPPRLYNQIVRKIADAQHNDIVANARLFALCNAAMADAGILAWDDKYVYDVWRPVLGVREHDSSTGPTGVGGSVLNENADPFWLPLGAPKTNEPGKKNFTPPFPAYPSGHATFGAAIFQSVRRFYDICEKNNGPDNLADGLEFVSEELDGINVDNTGTVRPRHARSFPNGLWEMIEENGRSRLFLGVHWLFDAFGVDENGEIDLAQNIGGVSLGLAIANDLANNGLSSTAAAGPRLP